MPSDNETMLVTAAVAASKRAYAPYSRFVVGAAVCSSDGRIYTGSNVENASFGLSMCAERSAVFAAVGAGHRRLTTIVIYTPTKTATTPCGACRQVLREFGPGTLAIVCVCDAPERRRFTLQSLLPEAFGPESLA